MDWRLSLGCKPVGPGPYTGSLMLVERVGSGLFLARVQPPAVSTLNHSSSLFSLPAASHARPLPLWDL